MPYHTYFPLRIPYKELLYMYIRTFHYTCFLLCESEVHSIASIFSNKKKEWLFYILLLIFYIMRLLITNDFVSLSDKPKSIPTSFVAQSSLSKLPSLRKSSPDVFSQDMQHLSSFALPIPSAEFPVFAQPY